MSGRALRQMAERVAEKNQWKNRGGTGWSETGGMVTLSIGVYAQLLTDERRAHDDGAETWPRSG